MQPTVFDQQLYEFTACDHQICVDSGTQVTNPQVMFKRDSLVEHCL